MRCLSFHDSPRRAHSVAAQGGINAAKNYQNDGDSVERLFHDTLEGGDFRSRESNVYRLAELSARIIDQAVAQGVPFAREYGGHLANRSFGGALVSRTFYARGQTGQQLLLGAYQALAKEVAAASVTVLPRREMLDLIVVDGRARGVVARDLVSGALEVHVGDAVVLATGGYANVYFLSTNAKASNATAIWRAYRRGAAFANPGFVQFHPTCSAGGRRAPGQAHAHVRVAAQRRTTLGAATDGRRPPARGDPRGRARLLPRAPLSALRQPRAARPRLARGQDGVRRGPRRGAGRTRASISTCATRRRVSAPACCASATATSSSCIEHITGDDPLQVPMRIAPAAHYTMGGLWVDYDLMTTIPGLFAIGEANFSDQGANRLGASALMQGLADGYFILPCTLAGYLAGAPLPAVAEDGAEARAALAEVRARIETLLSDLRASDGERLPPRARPRAVGRLWAGAQPRRPGQGDRRDRRAPRGVLGGRDRARRAGRAEPGAGARRPRGRLPRARRADVS